MFMHACGSVCLSVCIECPWLFCFGTDSCNSALVNIRTPHMCAGWIIIFSRLFLYLFLYPCLFARYLLSLPVPVWRAFDCTYVHVCFAALAFPRAWSAGQWRICSVMNPVLSSRQDKVSSRMRNQQTRCLRWGAQVFGPNLPSTRMTARQRLAHGRC